MLGRRIKELREAKGLVQRQVAAELEVDTAFISKIENGEKSLSRLHLKKLSKILDIPEDELNTLWLSAKLYDVVKEEKNALEALTLTIERISNIDKQPDITNKQ